HYLSGAITFDALVNTVDARTASAIVWMDCLIFNVDRTARNTNMLMWHKELWLIDHGAAFYFHHAWENMEQQAKRPFVQVKDHVLLPLASELEAVDSSFRELLSPDKLRAIVALIPDAWLVNDSPFATPAAHRQAYVQFLETRLTHTEVFVKEAQNARKALV
ncbi:MAG TPA: HipA family kinase, partial [Adhaeribacter sp.]|nr:HipA family kinase [Adhaeribacter sp.]